MSVITLLYHDVTEAGKPDASGFPGGAAAVYKLTPSEFARHLDAIAASRAPVGMLRDGTASASRRILLTFDDGGVSAYAPIADALEARGWRGHFFVTSDYIGASAFLTGTQVRELHDRGHLIGSHSASHPPRMSSCSQSALVEEWRASSARLSDLLGTLVTTGSVPGGYYSHRVGEAAAEAGLRVLFTSEPTVRTHVVEGCAVLGRYAVRNGTPAAVVGQIAAGQLRPRMQQWLAWNGKKVAKRLSWPLYQSLRLFLLG